MLQVQVRKAGATACTPLPPPSPPLPNPALFACFQAAFALFDVPEAIAVLRTSICALTPLTRLEALAYYMGEAGGGGEGGGGRPPHFSHAWRHWPTTWVRQGAGERPSHRSHAKRPGGFKL